VGASKAGYREEKKRKDVDGFSLAGGVEEKRGKPDESKSPIEGKYRQPNRISVWPPDQESSNKVPYEGFTNELKAQNYLNGRKKPVKFGARWAVDSGVQRNSDRPRSRRRAQRKKFAKEDQSMKDTQKRVPQPAVGGKKPQEPERDRDTKGGLAF